MIHRLPSSVLALLVLGTAVQAAQLFSPTADSRHKVRATEPLQIQMLREDGAKLVAAYDAFTVFEVSAAGKAFYAKDPAVEAADEWFRVELNAGAFDVRSSKAVASRAARTAVEAKGRRLHLVQFAGPVKPGWTESLEADGWRIVDYIPQNAYLVYGDEAARTALTSRLAKRPEVQWQGAYLDDDKVQPRAKASMTDPALAAAARNTYAVQLVRDAQANVATEALIDALKLEPVLRRSASGKYVNLIVALPPAQLLNLAGQPDVLSIELYARRTKLDERQDIIMTGQLTGVAPTGPGYLAWLASKGFAETQFVNSGFVVDVTDSGVDNGTSNANHFGLYRLGNTGLVSRVIYNRLEGTPNAGSSLQGCDGHGNLNAHIIMGYNDRTGFPHEDGSGFNYGLGVCPFVKVGSSVIFDPDAYTFPDLTALISRAYRDGARVSGNSWGENPGSGGYDLEAQEYDGLVRDAQPAGSPVPVAGNQEMTIVFANGNDGPGATTVGSPATAKNVLSVGAAENVQAFGGADASGIDDDGADSANDMIDFSSRGPCTDGRIKPDLVAPGTHISGGVAQENLIDTGTGAAIACFDGSGVSGGAGSNFHPPGQEFFSASSGTSHSTPAAAGACALVRQWFLNGSLNAPSPAMVKAWLMSSTRYMSGAGANDSLYSNNQGMGGVNLGMAFDGTPRIIRDQLAADLFTASGQARTYVVNVVSNAKPFRVTLAWTDAPGSTTGNAYVNNLDLRVVTGGTVYRGNVFSGAFSTNGGSADVRNNVESVFLPAGTTGLVAITVTATAIGADAVPNSGGASDQDFGLVIYNGASNSAAMVIGAGQVIRTESCVAPATNNAVDPGETVSVALALQNAGNVNTTNLVATLLAGNGVSAPGAAQTYGVLTGGGAPVTNVFTFTATGLCQSTISAVLQLTDGAANLGTVTFPFTLGARVASGSRGGTNAANITLVDDAAATPYPSTINITGLSGTVSKVTATLRGVAHTWPDDINVLLVGPGGDSVILMANAGAGNAITGRTLTFDDDAAAQLPDSALISSGTFKPSDYSSGGAAFPAPAPSGPRGANLAAFVGTSPTGTWSLFAFDDAGADSGNIAQGWSLQIDTTAPSCCGHVPPVIGALDPIVTTIGSSVTFTVTATPTDGDAVTLTATNLPGGSTFTPAGASGTFTWTFPSPAGVYAPRFVATDVDGSSTYDVSITVTSPPVVGGCGVIISEYVEGARSNRAIEIYNGGTSSVNLGTGGYLLQIAYGGSATFSNITLAGTIAAGGCFVVVHTSSTNTLAVLGNQNTPNFHFDGDDAIVLRKGGAGGSVVDRIGAVGNDPGAYWGSLTNRTQDMVLRRKPGVNFGDTNATLWPFTPSDQWLAYPSNDFSNVGTHIMDCQLGGTNDLDGDGMADQWETLYFGDTVLAGPATDIDGDGFTDAQEYLLGTSPVDAASLLKIVQHSSVTNGVVIRWSSASNRVYRLSAATNLPSGFNPVVTNIAAVPPQNVYTTAPPTGSVQQIYRVELQP